MAFSLEDGKRSVIRAGAIADDLPTEAGTHLSQRVRIGVPERDGVVGVEGDDEVIIVTSERYQPLRTFNSEVQGYLPE